MEFTSREKKILSTLYTNSRKIVIADLADICGVTTRTIKKDIESINYKLDVNDAKIATKSGVGVWLEISTEDMKQNFKRYISDNKEFKNPILPDERYVWIINKLVETNELISFSEMAEELYVSKSTIVNDLIKVEEFLNEFNATLSKQKKHGTKIIADEKTLRLLKANIYKKILDKHQSVITEDLINLIKGVDLELIKDILVKNEEEYNFILSDISFKGLLIHIGISINRIKQDKNVRMVKEDISLLKKQSEWNIAENIAKDLSQAFQVNIDECEIGYITIHLAGAKIQNDISDNRINDSYLKDIDEELYFNLKLILDKISLKTGFDFSKDRTLFVALFLHIRPAINRLKNNIRLDNPYKEEIKKEYSMEYALSTFACQDIQEIYDIQANDDEICYIAMHFGASIERSKDQIKTKAILICASGLGTSQLLYTKVNKEFPSIEVVKVMGYNQALGKLKDLSYDIIISTVPFQYEGKEVINVSPLLTRSDSERISNAINTKPVYKNNFLSTSNVLFSYLNLNSIFLKIKENSRDEILKSMCMKLKELGAVEDRYYESVMKREEFKSTAIGNLVAIPHSFDGYVNKSQIAIATLKNPISWGEDKVQMVCMIALNVKDNKDFSEIFDNLEKIISRKENVKLLSKQEDKLGFINLLNQLIEKQGE
jgi:transcriptional antiterminator